MTTDELGTFFCYSELDWDGSDHVGELSWHEESKSSKAWESKRGKFSISLDVIKSRAADPKNVRSRAYTTYEMLTACDSRFSKRSLQSCELGLRGQGWYLKMGEVE